MRSGGVSAARAGSAVNPKKAHTMRAWSDVKDRGNDWPSSEDYSGKRAITLISAIVVNYLS